MERRLAAILAADVVGYARLIRADEEGTLRRLKTLLGETIEPAIAEHKGRIVKLMGDGVLAEFPSVVDAVRAAAQMQRALYESNLERPDVERIAFRMGINLGDVVIDGDDIQGDGVNLAARLEGLAEPGSVCISDAVHEQVRDRLDISFEDLGERQVKNIDRPVRIWNWAPGARRPARPVPKQVETPPLPARPSIVILPFRNLTGNPEQDYLGDGLRIDIQNALVKVSGVFIIAAGSANANSGKAAGEAARNLGVRHVLEGSVRQAGKRLRIAATLTDTVSGEIVWAENFDRTMDDTFELMDEITGHILTAMNVELIAGEPAKVWHKTLRDLRSLETFYKGIHAFFKMDREALSEARRHFERVADLRADAAIGPTWVALTHWYDYQRGWSDSREESKRLARDWAERATAMEDCDGQAHTVLSHVHLLDRDFDAALAAGRGAVENRPNCTHANGFYANVLHYYGEQELAIHHIKLAMRYSPIHPTLFKDILAIANLAADDLGGAVAAANDAIAAAPNDLVAQLVLTSAGVRADGPESTAPVVEEIGRIDPAFSVARFAEGQPYRNPEFLDRLTSDLRAAGLPD
jgi:adenylate cyclase